MTCIVGVVDGDTVYIGGDSAGVSGLNLKVRSDTKVFKNGPYIFGFTTSFRMGQLLQYSLKLPKPPKKNLHKFMCTTFIDKVRKCFASGGWLEKKDNVDVGGQFLVGVNGHLYTIFDDYQVAEVVYNYNACGCGEEFALGSLATSDKTGKSIPERILIALGVAEKFSAGVRKPFTVVSTAKEKKRKEKKRRAHSRRHSR